jgi:hypothetical protein
MQKGKHHRERKEKLKRETGRNGERKGKEGREL